jgi:hypothetical protein
MLEPLRVYSIAGEARISIKILEFYTRIAILDRMLTNLRGPNEKTVLEKALSALHAAYL